MKKAALFLLVVGLGFVAGSLFMSNRESARYARILAAERLAWDAEKAALEARLNGSPTRGMTGEIRARSSSQNLSPSPVDPQAVLAELLTLNVPAPGPGHARAMRHVISLLEQLTGAGPDALSPIQQFLVSAQDVAYEVPGGKSFRDVKAVADALTPISLRFGLFDVVSQIGGHDAETILADSLTTAVGGLELAYLTDLLEKLSPGKYQAAAIAAAQALLARTDLATFDRDHLFGLLRRLNDNSYVTNAQGQLVGPDGRVDRSALRYLQQSMGDQSIALATQLYSDPRITEADSKEPLARLALTYVGTSEEAARLFHTSVLDQALKRDDRRNLIEDLNTDGLSSKKSPTAADLAIIAKRYAMTQAYLKEDYVQNDRLLNEAFREADKDLRNMLINAGLLAPQ